jgi:hypothetical protein
MDQIHELSYEGILKLLEVENDEAAVTMYVPTHRAGTPPHMSDDQTRMKNLTHKAIALIDDAGGSHTLKTELKGRLDELLNEREFWVHLTEGLLICAREGQFDMFYLPVDTEEYVAVDSHFYLAPALGILHDAAPFYVLAIGEKAPMIFAGDMYELMPTEIGLPSSLKEALNIDEMERRQVQHHSQPGAGTAGYHGQRGAKEIADEDRIKFFRMIDRIVVDKTDTKLPLILAGTENEIAEYRSISNLPNILDGDIRGNFSAARPYELFEPAQAIIKREIIGENHQAAIEEFERVRGQNPERAADDITTISKAAKTGRIDKLLIAMNRLTTDTVRDNSEQLPRITFPRDEPSQKISGIARDVSLQSGSIFNIEQTAMPRGRTILAVYRY